MIHIDNRSAAASLAREVKLPSPLEQDAASTEWEESSEIETDDPILLRAESLREKGDLPRAIELLRAESRVRGADAALMSRLGSMLITAGKLDEAVSTLRGAMDLDPGDVRARYNLGVALGRQGRYGAAISAYDEAVELQPGHFKALFNAGKASAALGEEGRAAEYFRRAAESAPPFKSAKTHFELGRVQGRLDQISESIASYRQAIVLRPDYAEARNNLALALEDAGELESAVVELEKAARLDPGRASIQYNLGRLYQKAGRSEAAAGRYELAVNALSVAAQGAPAAGPDPVGAAARAGSARVLRGHRGARPRERRGPGPRSPELYREVGEPDDAERALVRWLELDPRRSSAWNSLGIIRAQRKRDPEAVEAYDRAIQLDPEFLAPRFNRALALERLARDGDAVAAFGSVLERDPSHIGARTHLRR